MNLRHSMAVLSLLALAAGAAQAQSSKSFDVGVSVISGGGMSLKNDITHQGFGGGVEFGYWGKLASSGVDFRASLGVNVMPGKEALMRNQLYRYDAFAGDLKTADQNEKNSLVGYQLGADIFTNTGIEGLRIQTGITFNKWQFKRKATFADATPYVTGYTAGGAPIVGSMAAGTVHYDESGSVDGIEFGGRIGLDYRMNDSWSANLTFQIVELGKDYYGSRGLNPAWLQVGARFHF